MARPIALRATATALGAMLAVYAADRAMAPGALAAEDEGPILARPPLMEGQPTWYLDHIKRKQEKLLDDLGDKRASAAVPSALVILKTVQWAPGATITVAFNGGNARLRARIEQFASDWTKYANIKLDFRDASGKFREWNDTDEDYKADVRVGFENPDNPGYWSSIGKNATDPDVAQPGAETLNLQGFDHNLPFGFAGTVRHEFGHVLGLEHEHQHPLTACDFRWDDEDGYQPTTNQFGTFIPDKNGRHPGIYTYMMGPPNKWSKEKIDANLRQLTEQPDMPLSAFGFGAFDKFSIMKYYYPDWMFVSGKNSVCYSPNENVDLSEEDRRRIAIYYPKDTAVATARVRQATQAIDKALAGLPQSSLLAKELQMRRHQLQ